MFKISLEACHCGLLSEDLTSTRPSAYVVRVMVLVRVTPLTVDVALEEDVPTTTSDDPRRPPEDEEEE